MFGNIIPVLNQRVKDVWVLCPLAGGNSDACILHGYPDFSCRTGLKSSMGELIYQHTNYWLLFSFVLPLSVFLVPSNKLLLLEALAERLFSGGTQTSKPDHKNTGPFWRKFY